MADTETIRAKLRKIAALAERGVGGECDNAKVKKQPPDLTAGEFNRREC